jgi:hypothetical protein
MKFRFPSRPLFIQIIMSITHQSSKYYMLVNSSQEFYLPLSFKVILNSLKFFALEFVPLLEVIDMAFPFLLFNSSSLVYNVLDVFLFVG